MSRVCNFCPRTDLTDADFYSTRNICKSCAIVRNNARAKRLIADKKCVDCQGPVESGSRCEVHKKVHRERYHANRIENAKTAKERRQRLKRAAFEAYGGAKCACCGEDHMEFLSIDHIAGDGAEHRRQLLKEAGWRVSRSSMCGAHLYKWLKQNNYPPGFRVLCMNCNFSIAKFGYCPHKGLAPTASTGKLRAAVPARTEVLS